MELKHYIAAASARHTHAARCKKAPDECKVCVASIQWFADLPLYVLSVVLAEHPTQRAEAP